MWGAVWEACRTPVSRRFHAAAGRIAEGPERPLPPFSSPPFLAPPPSLPVTFLPPLSQSLLTTRPGAAGVRADCKTHGRSGDNTEAE